MTAESPELRSDRGSTHGEYWSDELEELHEESSRDHFLDVWNRAAILERIGEIGPKAVVVDIGCSTGYLMEDLRSALPNAALIGLDYVFAGLPIAAELVPSGAFGQADTCFLPFPDGAVDAIVTANLLEHVPDDTGALAEFRRVLRPGGRAVVVVPHGPKLFDYYDRFLLHQRRYRTGELPEKATRAGFFVREDIRIGALIYPAFWVVKKRNRARRSGLEGDALEAQIRRDIASTSNPRIGKLLVKIEKMLIDRHVRLRFGIRELVVLERR